MTYINERAGYPTAINPIDRTIAFGPGFNRVSSDAEGLYKRDDLEAAQIAHIEVTLSDVPEVAGLYDWQLWGQQSWKPLHGTHKAVQRFSTKLREEYKELCHEVPESFGPESVDGADRKALIGEIGDVAWCVLALASNGSANIDHGAKNYLYEAAMGIRYIDDDGQYVNPRWRERAATLSTTIDRQLTLGDVDALVAEGFVAEPSNQMNIFYIRDEFDEDPQAYFYARSMMGDLMVLESLAEQQYGFGDTEIASCGEPHGWVGQMAYSALSKELQMLSAKVLFQLALVARKSCQATLAEAASQNVRKLKARVAAGLIDKTDGVRSEGTL